MDDEPQDDATEDIRVGSPFAESPETLGVDQSPSAESSEAKTSDLDTLAEDVYFVASPFRYTAMGAVAASAMVVVFGLSALIWFPVGATMIAGLGCLLSILGLYSHRRMLAGILLVTHLSIFAITYATIVLSS